MAGATWSGRLQQDAGRLSRRAGAVRDAVERVGEVGMVELLRDAQAEAQVVGADEQHVGAVDRRDLARGGDPLGRLDLEDGEQPVVGAGAICGEVGAEARGADRRGDAADPRRRVAHGRNRRGRLLRRLHVRHHDAVGPRVQRALEARRLVPGDPHHRRNGRAGSDLELPVQGLQVPGAVFDVEHQKVEAGVAGDLDGDRRAHGAETAGDDLAGHHPILYELHRRDLIRTLTGDQEPEAEAGAEACAAAD